MASSAAAAADGEASAAILDLAATLRRTPIGPREVITLDCAACCLDGWRRLVGEHETESLGFVAARPTVTAIHRPTRGRCDGGCMAQTAMPTGSVQCGMAGPHMLPISLVTRLDNHGRRSRQGAILACLGADIPRPAVVDRCSPGRRPQPAGQPWPFQITAAERPHADDTPSRVLGHTTRLGGTERAGQGGRAPPGSAEAEAFGDDRALPLGLLGRCRGRPLGGGS